MSVIEKINNALEVLNLACVIDHSGRAGNAFFLTIFDQHPRVLSCPLMHYTYSYIISEFDQTVIDAQHAKEFLIKKSYFRLLYNPHDLENNKLIKRMGMNTDASVNYQKIIEYLDCFFDTREVITRREFVLLPFIIYGLAHGRDLSIVKYVLVSDAISLRTENVNTGYSGKIVDKIVEDFPKAKLINLVRDPRATFASPRHQFVNWLGNMYSVKPGNFFARLNDLWKRNLQMDNTCVYLFWLLYLAQSARAVTRKKNQYKDHFLSVKNEDLNHHFIETSSKVCEWLDVPIDPLWHQSSYTPTILGEPWLGTGAYNSRYQTVTNGRLVNESEEVSQKIIGPNTHVTQRWQQRLNKREIKLIERLFQEEIEFYSYKRLWDTRTDSDLKNYFTCAILPFEGELPSFKWILNGVKESFSEFINRCNYAIVFLPFYISSRIVLYDYIFRKKFFKNIYI